MPTIDKKKVQRVMQVAQDEFWGVVAAHYPEIKTGDFPPDATFALDKALTDAIEIWVAGNTPCTEEDE